MLKSFAARRLLGLTVAGAVLVNAQYGPYGPGHNGSYPHVYPGMPTGDLSPQWQAYFQVTQSLPNVTFDLSRNWAGNIPVNRPGHPNNTLFFWAFEKEDGSLTANAGDRSDEPWGIFLNSAGAAGQFPLAFDNGPIQIANDYSVQKNNYSWHHLADWIWVDTIINSGLSTADVDTQPIVEDLLAEDFLGFLTNLVKVFPSLKTRPLHIVGNGGASIDITYIARHYFNHADPPVNIRKLAIANAGFGPETGEASLMSAIDTWPQLIQYDPEVYQYFQRRINECGYNLSLTYPPTGKYPTLHYGDSPCPSSTEPCPPPEPLKGQFACGGLFNEVTTYGATVAPPWSNGSGLYDPQDVRDALNPFSNMDGTVFFNGNDAVRTALHAPLSSVKPWFWTDFLDMDMTDSGGDIQPISEFMDELAIDMTQHNVSLVFYSGNNDFLNTHFALELTIQNSTFGGAQGFTRKPATAWTDDSGRFAGVVHQERGWTYALVDDAGAFVSRNHPERAYVFLREFILGNNQTGLVVGNTVVGGEDSTVYVNGNLPGHDGIFTGSGTIQGQYTYPTATIEAWKSFSASVHATATPTPTSSAKVSARFRVTN